jgi:hypothetical protein
MAAAAPPQAAGGDNLLRVTCNVLGMYIPGLQHVLGSTDKGHRNVIAKPFFFDLPRDTTLSDLLLNHVLRQPGLNFIVNFFQERSPPLDEDNVFDAAIFLEHFEAFRRSRKRRLQQITDPAHPAAQQYTFRMEYTTLPYVNDWGPGGNVRDTNLQDCMVGRAGDLLCITFAIWQPWGGLIEPQPILSLIQGIMPNHYPYVGSPSHCVDPLDQSSEWARWPVENAEDPDGRLKHDNRLGVIHQACLIVRDSILWDLEKELWKNCGADGKKMSEDPEFGEPIMREILRNRGGIMSIQELIAAKLDTLPFFAVCYDLEHWRYHLVNGAMPSLAYIKANDCPTCGFHSEHHSFYVIRRTRVHPAAFNIMNELYATSVLKLPGVVKRLYRGANVPPEWYSFHSYGAGNDPRTAVQLRTSVQLRGKCGCFPFHRCENNTLLDEHVQLFEHRNDCSFSTDRNYVETCYARFDFKHFGRRLLQALQEDPNCGCLCAGCSRLGAPVAFQQRPDHDSILNLLRILENEHQQYPYQLGNIPNPQNELSAAQYLVGLGVFQWQPPQQQMRLNPGPQCSGTLLEFKCLGRNIDAISAEQFATGVREFEFVVTKGSQMSILARRIDAGVVVIDMNGLLNINTLPAPFYSTELYIEQKVLNTRQSLPGGIFISLNHLLSFTDPATSGFLADRAMYITFGSQDHIPAENLRESFLKSKGRLAYLFPDVLDNMEHPDHKPMVKNWNGILWRIDTGYLCRTFGDCVRGLDDAAVVALAAGLDAQFDEVTAAAAAAHQRVEFIIPYGDTIKMKQAICLARNGRPNMRELRHQMKKEGQEWDYNPDGSIAVPMVDEHTRALFQDELFGFIQNPDPHGDLFARMGPTANWCRRDRECRLLASMVFDDMYHRRDDAVELAEDALVGHFGNLNLNPDPVPAENWFQMTQNERRDAMLAFLAPRTLFEVNRINIDLCVDVLCRFFLSPPLFYHDVVALLLPRREDDLHMLANALRSLPPPHCYQHMVDILKHLPLGSYYVVRMFRLLKNLFDSARLRKFF